MSEIGLDVNRFYEFGLMTKEAIQEIIDECYPRITKETIKEMLDNCYPRPPREDDIVSIAYRDNNGMLKQKFIKITYSEPQKIVPIRCICCGGKIVNNKCIYCDTEFYVER